MKLIKQSGDPAGRMADVLANALRQHQRVVWLLSGGSNVPISVAAMRQIEPALSQRLVIMQLDERFVGLDSPDSNWHQLAMSGFDPKQAETRPVLVTGLDLEQTVEQYQQTIQTQFTLADCIVGQFGIGRDGHTAGILPGSAATTATGSVVGYQAADFSRISLTFAALRRINIAVAFVFGNAKRAALEALVAGNQSLADVPAGILREIADSSIYNDQIERQDV